MVDVEVLCEVMSLLWQFWGFLQVQGVEQVVVKVLEALWVWLVLECIVLQLEDNMVGFGLEWFDLLYCVCCDQCCLLFDYYLFKVLEGYKFCCIVSLYLVKEYNNCWFLFVYDYEVYCIWIYVFDCIWQVEVYLFVDFVENLGFQLQ